MRIRPVRLSVMDVLSLGTVGLRTRRMRAVLSALGIAVGIATMVAVTAIPESNERALMDELAALGPNLLQVSAADNPEQDFGLPPESVEMTGRIAPVTSVSAVANTHAVVRRSDLTDPRDGAGLAVLASRPDLLATLEVEMYSGHFLDRAGGEFPTVVLGSVAASRLGIPSVPSDGPPPQIMIGRSWFAVVGILATTPLSPEIDRAVLVGWEAARAELGFDGRPTVLYLRAQEAAIESVRAVLPATVHPGEPSRVRVTLPSDALFAKRATERTFSVLFVGLAMVALLVGGIGVANTMVISVLERRSEIGLRRALGANRGQIRVQFLTESVVLSALGGAAGTALGIAGSAGYAIHHDLPVVIPALAVAGSLGGAIVVGVIAGVYPSIRAARLAPTVALASA
ncbi:ABC transporter permease [Catenuloplanes atrovinosus]|uniref:ABC transport system permease protein n=1 Tax=Catenuloplanes atrovinosus TaxID=137266 RepID=A0AAE3YVE9_9ACTN|nr:ABC transporter permease [Catenuloplanes atrovinosus]MDR7279235.1 putative ABC transport system permease protein [Catenuloplanes atrovinosus]